MSDEEMATQVQDEIGQKLEQLMKMVFDLSSRVQVTEDHQREAGMSPTSSPSTSCPVRRSR